MHFAFGSVEAPSDDTSVQVVPGRDGLDGHPDALTQGQHAGRLEYPHALANDCSRDAKFPFELGEGGDRTHRPIPVHDAATEFLEHSRVKCGWHDRPFSSSATESMRGIQRLDRLDRAHII